MLVHSSVSRLLDGVWSSNSSPRRRQEMLLYDPKWHIPKSKFIEAAMRKVGLLRGYTMDAFYGHFSDFCFHSNYDHIVNP